MPLNHVYARPLKENFRAGLCSGAFLFQLLSILLTIIAPLLIAYQSQGFWQKTNVYREQPLVGFEYRYLFLLRTDRHDAYFLWSSFAGLNSLESTHLRIPLIDSSEIDLNRDGKPDQLALKVQFPLNSDEAIHSVIWMLLFDYQLETHSRFQMQTLINGEYEKVISGSGLKVTGDLKLSQRVPLFDRGVDTRFNFAVINGSSLDANDFSIRGILEKNMARNITTFLAPLVQVWTPAPPGSSANFELDFTINFPEDMIVYYSGFWQLIKWAWVQYFSVLVIFIFIIRRIREFVFGNRIVNVVPERSAGTSRHTFPELLSTAARAFT